MPRCATTLATTDQNRRSANAAMRAKPQNLMPPKFGDFQ